MCNQHFYAVVVDPVGTYATRPKSKRGDLSIISIYCGESAEQQQEQHHAAHVSCSSLPSNTGILYPLPRQSGVLRDVIFVRFFFFLLKPRKFRHLLLVGRPTFCSRREFSSSRYCVALCVQRALRREEKEECGGNADLGGGIPIASVDAPPLSLQDAMFG